LRCFYFHIPFCSSICPYCDFKKTSHFKKQSVTSFFNLVENQLEMFLEVFSHIDSPNTPATIYFGGGTPSLVPAVFYKKIISQINSRYHILENTMECNPFHLSKFNAQEYINLGINRFTLGAQSLCENTLKYLGRKHTPKNILESICFLKQAGAEQVQVDLIFGLKEELRNKLQVNLKLSEQISTLIEFGATGISAYCLTIENSTAFKNERVATDEVFESDYLEIQQHCTNLGLKQLETSNYSFFESLHNSNYWQGGEYIGIGTGAHGFLPCNLKGEKQPFGIRYEVGAKSEEQISAGNYNLDFRKNDENLFSITWQKPRTKNEMIEEMIITNLRMPQGICENWIHQNINPLKIEAAKNNALIQRAICEEKFFWNSAGMRLAPAELMRGDSWSLKLIELFS
jgi:oxygen-independent coproporphyrinogen III oxidase